MKPICLVTLFLLFLVFACKKENTTPPSEPLKSKAHPCPPTPAMVNAPMIACKFKAGTFWVFQDSLTNKIDTLLIEKLEREDAANFLPSGPCPVESHVLYAAFRNDTGIVLINFRFSLQDNGFLLLSEFFWKEGYQTTPFIYSGYITHESFKIWDSLYLSDRFYKKVGVSYEIKFVRGNAIYCQTLRTYFNPEFGFLQFDLRNPFTGTLTGRRKIIERHILR